MSDFASTTASRLAAELGLVAATITGSGRAGRITIADVRAAADEGVPPGLGDAGAALWRAVMATVPEDDWELDEREQTVLLMAARQADDLASLEAVIAAEGPMATGSTGQRVVHPAVQEARQARIALGRLLAQIGFPEDTAGDASRRGQKAARDRWRRHGRREPAENVLPLFGVGA